MNPVEPSAEMRNAAHGLFEMFTALMNAGFTDHQALVIIGNMLAGSQKREGK